MTEEKTFRKTKPVAESTAVTAGDTVNAAVDFAMLESRDQLKSLLQAEMADKPNFPQCCSTIVERRLLGIFCWIRWKRPAIPLMISMRLVR